MGEVMWNVDGIQKAPHGSTRKRRDILMHNCKMIHQ